MNTIKLSSLMVVIALLPACGGGGGGENSSGEIGGGGGGSNTSTSIDEVTDTGTGSQSPADNPESTGGAGPGSSQEESVEASDGIVVDTSGGAADIPPTVSSSASSMGETVVPDGFSYNPVIEEQFVVDIRGYSSSEGYITIYGEFTENGDGTFAANYNSRIISAPLANGQATLDFVSSNSQYYVLAEVWFYDGTNPVQKRIPNTEDSWVW